MATDNSSQSGMGSASTAVASLLRGRDRLARMVVVGSFLTLFLLVATLVTLAQGTNTAASEAAEKVFNTILPVLAGWVGTVLAFYFSSASQEHTSAILDKTIGRVAGGSVTGGLASEKMIPFQKIQGRRDLRDMKPESISLENLQADFKQSLPNGAPVTRLVFVEGGVFKYLLHASVLNAYIVKNGSNKSFADMLTDSEVVNQISKLVVFVSASSSLADAKNALDKVAGAQDIIVTGSGNATEPMLGWLTNVDLTKALTVS